MKIDINLEKKKQRKIAAKNRFLIHQSTVVNLIDLKKELFTNKFFKNKKIIASFLSIKTEISTVGLNNDILGLRKILCLPVMTKNSDILLFSKYQSGDNLKIGNYKVSEPVGRNFMLPNIIIVPCLSFDLCGYRLGYGGGFYDKTFAYLKKIKHSFISIGFAYDKQKVQSVIHDELDQKLNYILTEKSLYKIK